MALINGWFKIIDTEYDMVFIDEAQDFDNVMLKMLLKQTTIPKVFVGDPRQAIYKWRGAINSFDELPYDIKKLIIHKCMEKLAGPYSIIPDFNQFLQLFAMFFAHAKQKPLQMIVKTVKNHGFE